MSGILKINNPARECLRVLVAPLDWGLGHATRCIPIIKALKDRKCEVWLAVSGDQKMLLEGEFPLLSFVEFPGYNIAYSKNRAFTRLKLMASIPSILSSIRREKQALRRLADQIRPDLIISDNRYGCQVPGIPSVFMTHQLSIQTGMGAAADSFLQRLNYRFIDRFDTCWVPDWPGRAGLAGRLSHPSRMPAVETKYVGPLSRFGIGGTHSIDAAREYKNDRNGTQYSADSHFGSRTEDDDENIQVHHGDAGGGEDTVIDLLILLSGPEPQRTIFEEMLRSQLTNFQGKAVLVRGRPQEKASIERSGNLTIYPHLPAAELERQLRGAHLVLSRAGYSTIMDLARLGKKAILVPTPGQSEQEYLGPYLQERKLALSFEQKNFSLKDALAAASGFSFAGSAESVTSEGLLDAAIDELLQKIRC